MPALTPFALLFSPLGLAAAVTAVLVIVAAWETISLREGPTPQDTLLP